jgi:ATP adenylyltransferase
VKTIWAPWRMQYILSEKESGCLFCKLPAEGRDRDNLILYRTGLTYVIMNRYPYNNGHLMVVPYLHTPSLEGRSPEALGEMMETTRYAIACLSAAFRPEGFNAGINIGKVAGAGMEEHLHVHIVPRWAGDASFMTVLGEVRVIPEHIMDTYDKLYPVFNKAGKT